MQRWFGGLQQTFISVELICMMQNINVTLHKQWQEQFRTLLRNLCCRLRISYAKPSDSGNYSCVPTVAERASVNVHVINGECVCVLRMKQSFKSNVSKTATQLHTLWIRLHGKSRIQITRGPFSLFGFQKLKWNLTCHNHQTQFQSRKIAISQQQEVLEKKNTFFLVLKTVTSVHRTCLFVATNGVASAKTVRKAGGRNTNLSR